MQLKISNVQRLLLLAGCVLERLTDEVDRPATHESYITDRSRVTFSKSKIVEKKIKNILFAYLIDRFHNQIVCYL
jgi:hypothetical protein